MVFGKRKKNKIHPRSPSNGCMQCGNLCLDVEMISMVGIVGAGAGRLG